MRTCWVKHFQTCQCVLATLLLYTCSVSEAVVEVLVPDNLSRLELMQSIEPDQVQLEHSAPHEPAPHAEPLQYAPVASSDHDRRFQKVRSVFARWVDKQRECHAVHGGTDYYNVNGQNQVEAVMGHSRPAMLCQGEECCLLSKPTLQQL